MELSASAYVSNACRSEQHHRVGQTPFPLKEVLTAWQALKYDPDMREAREHFNRLKKLQKQKNKVPALSLRAAVSNGAAVHVQCLLRCSCAGAWFLCVCAMRRLRVRL